MVPVQPMVWDFYAAMGWDADGRPTPEKLRELGLETCYEASSDRADWPVHGTRF